MSKIASAALSKALNLEQNTYNKTEADALVAGVHGRGNYSASSNTFPSTGGSGTAGAIMKDDLWIISVAGTLGGKWVASGDTIRAMVDSPAQTANNWNITKQNTLKPLPNPTGTNGLYTCEDLFAMRDNYYVPDSSLFGFGETEGKLSVSPYKVGTATYVFVVFVGSDSIMRVTTINSNDSGELDEAWFIEPPYAKLDIDNKIPTQYLPDFTPLVGGKVPISYLPTDNNSLYGKKLVAIGDSLTQGMGETSNTNSAFGKLKIKNGMTSIYNGGNIGGDLSFGYSPANPITSSSFSSGITTLNVSAFLGGALNVGDPSSSVGSYIETDLVAHPIVVSIYDSSNALITGGENLQATEVVDGGSKYIKVATPSQLTIPAGSYFKFRYTLCMVNRLMATYGTPVYTGDINITGSAYYSTPYYNLALTIVIPQDLTVGQYVTIYKDGNPIANGSNLLVDSLNSGYIVVKSNVDISGTVGNSGCILKYHSMPSSPYPAYNNTAYPIDGDFYLIWGGTNDNLQGLPIGNDGDTDPSTFKGTLYQFCKYFLEIKPNVKVGFITPYHFFWGWRNGTLQTTPDYVEAMKSVCGKYGFPVLDLYHNSGINAENIVNRNTATIDGLHLKDAYYEIVLGKIEAFMRTL